MTSCEEYALLISQSLDDELSLEEKRLLQAHLETCFACRELYSELSELQASFPYLTLSPPPSLHTRILEQINQEVISASSVKHTMVPRAKWYRRFATTAAALVILMSAILLGFNRNLRYSAEETLTPPEASVAHSAPLERSLAEDAAPKEAANRVSDSEKNSTDTGTSDKLPLPSSKHTSEKPKASPSPPLAETIPASPSPPPTAFAAKGIASSPTEISQSDAETLLIEQLTEEGQQEPKPIFSRFLADSAAYEFLYTDSQGKTWVYSVSSLDGSITRSDLPSESLSTLP